MNGSNRSLLVVVVVINVVLVIAAVLLFNRYRGGAQIPTLTGNANNFFDNQSAFVIGKITKVSGDTITLQNSKGESASFPVSQPLIISKVGERGSSAATPSSNLKDIELNKSASVSFNMQNGTFKVVTVTYIPNIPPPPPPAPVVAPAGTTLPAAAPTTPASPKPAVSASPK